MIKEKLLQVLQGARLTEKSAQVSGGYRLYIFKVEKSATKIDIKNAVEHLFKVPVHKVCVANVKGKSVKFGRREGRCKSWKKAYVSLTKGQEIDLDKSLSEK